MYLMCDDGEEPRASNVVDQMNDVYHQVPPTPCAGCQLAIIDRYYLLVADRCWHLNCLRCCVCGSKLDGELTCFSRIGLIFCKEDYCKQFLKRCGRCNRILSPKELVMRAKDFTFHLQCFNCVVCACRLNPGDCFGLAADGVLYCQMHYEPLLYNAHSPAGANGQSTSANGNSTKSGRQKKRKSSSIDSSLSANCLIGSGSDVGGGSVPMSPTQQSMRSKRMRTSFKHHQLKTMKTYFALNHNPDAKDLKQLAQKTGLTKRVLQVWFQNARAKYRRAVQLKQEGAANGAADSSTKESPKKDEQASAPSSGHLMIGSDSSNLGGDSLASSGPDDGRMSPGGYEFRRMSTSLPSSSRKSPSNVADYPYSTSALHVDIEDDDGGGSKSLADYFQNCETTLL